jgi:hypothetical protein
MLARLALALIAAAAPFGAAADSFPEGAPALHWPVDCMPGQTCHVQNFFDHDPGAGWRDFACHGLSYDGHTATDIALPTRDRIAERVAVRAAAPGIVQGLRDGVADVLYTGQDLGGQDCGNGVVIDHGEGWVTQYCHLRQGSVSVAMGDIVATGDRLGDIGLSGRTEFAHVDFTLRKDGVPVDPFAPAGAQSCPPEPGPTYWAAPVAYNAGGLLDTGFADGIPDYDAVKAGTAETPLQRAAPLVLFAYGYGQREGDVLQLSITGPGGTVFTDETRLERTRAQAFRAGGLRAPEGGWPPGLYRGRAALIRDGKLLSERTRLVEMP